MKPRCATMLGAVDQEYLFDAAAKRWRAGDGAGADAHCRRDAGAQPVVRSCAAGSGDAAAPDRAGADRAGRGAGGRAGPRALAGAGAALRAEDLQLNYQIAMHGRAELRSGAGRIRGVHHDAAAHAGVCAAGAAAASERAAVAPRTARRLQVASRRPSTQPNGAAGTAPRRSRWPSTCSPPPRGRRAARRRRPRHAADAGNAATEDAGAESATRSAVGSAGLDATAGRAEDRRNGAHARPAQRAGRVGRPGHASWKCPRCTSICSRSPIATSCRRRWRSTSSVACGSSSAWDSRPGRRPRSWRIASSRRARQAAVQSIDRDPFVRELVENFDARVVDESIRPLDRRCDAPVDESIQGGG